MSRRVFNPMFQVTRSLRESGVNAGQSGARLSEHLTHRDPRPEHKKLLREARKDPELYVCRFSKLCLLFFSSTNICFMLPGSLHPHGSYSRRLWMVPTSFLGSHHWRDQSLQDRRHRAMERWRRRQHWEIPLPRASNSRQRSKCQGCTFSFEHSHRTQRQFAQGKLEQAS